MTASKPERQSAILELVQRHRVSSQRELRELLAERGVEVNQGTLSRDLRDLRLVKTPAAGGGAFYASPDSGDTSPALERLLPALFVSADGTGNLLVLRTVTGGAQPVALAIDQEDWPELLGTIAGDDTILLILRDAELLEPIQQRLEELAEG